MTRPPRLTCAAALALALAAAAGAAPPRLPLPEHPPALDPRFRLPPDANPLRRFSSLEGSAEGDARDLERDLEFLEREKLKELLRDLDPGDRWETRNDLRSLLERYGRRKLRARGRPLAEALLARIQQAMKARLDARLDARQARVRAYLRAEEALAKLDREAARARARARRHGRRVRQDRGTRDRATRRRALEAARREARGNLPLAELSLPGLARYRDELRGVLRSWMRELHEEARTRLRLLR